MIRWWALAIAVMMVIAPRPAAAAQRFVMEYEGVAYGFLHFGVARIEIEIEDQRYQSVASLHTEGLAALFSKTTLTANSTGERTAQRIAPQRYALDHFYRGGRRLLSIDWNGADTAVEASPPLDAPGNPAPTADERREGRDPLSTLLLMSFAAAGTEPCRQSFRVFDGIYVYDLTLSPAEESAATAPAEEGRIVKCALDEQRVAGYARPDDLAKRLPRAKIWFSMHQGAPFAVPVMISSPLPLGSATIRLKKISES